LNNGKKELGKRKKVRGIIKKYRKRGPMVSIAKRKASCASNPDPKREQEGGKSCLFERETKTHNQRIKHGAKNHAMGVIKR